MGKRHSRKPKQQTGGSKRQKDLPGDYHQWGAVAIKSAAGLAIIFCLTLVAYSPAIHGNLLLDDPEHLTAPALQSFHGLWRIWSEIGATPQYCPLSYSAFWMEHRLWGDAAVGYHLMNILLHSLCAGLVILILRRLRLPGAWLAGLIFALHPVCVEAVAWISQQESALSAFFYLASALLYLRFDENRRRSGYLCAMGLFVLALLSNPVTATLPVALLLILWWRLKRLRLKRDLLPLLPWLALSIISACLIAWGQRTQINARDLDFSLTFLQRFLLAGHAAWFYLAKLVWPSNLTLIYPRFTIDPGAWLQYLYPAGILALSACLLRWRGLLSGWLFFIVTLFPILGFLKLSPSSYSYVADHFQYLACLGIIVPVASGLALAVKKLPETGIFPASSLPFVTPVICGIPLAVLFLLTWNQTGMYADLETLLRTTITRNPGSSVAYNYLGEILFRQERVDEALSYARMAVKLNPDSAEANSNLANILRYQKRFDEAIAYYKKASDLRPDIASIQGSLANALLDVGKVEEAVPRYETALRLDASDGLLMNNLAWTLATCPKASVRNGARAVELALRAVQIIGSQDPTVMGTLAAAYAEAGRFKEAIEIEEEAYSLSKSMEDAEATEWHSQLLESYRAGEPHRENTIVPK